MLNNHLFSIKFIRRCLESAFILISLYSIFPLRADFAIVSRVWISTFFIFALFLITKVTLDKKNFKSLFSLDVFFFITLSAVQTIRNIYAPEGLPIVLYETIHYALVIFILFYNFKIKRLLETGLVLFTVYSFRIFDFRLADNEFVLVHALTVVSALIWLEEVYAKREMLPRLNSLFFAPVILIIAGILSSLKAACPYNAFSQAAIIINFIFVGFLIAAYLKEARQINLILFTFFLIGGVLIILAIKEVLYQLITTGSLHAALSRIWIGRVGSNLPTIHANSIAEYFSVVLCLVIGTFRFYKSRFSRRLAVCLIVVTVFILGLTYSRLGILSFIFALFVLSLLRYKKLINSIRKKGFYLYLGLIFIITLILLSPIKGQIIVRMGDLHSSNISLYSNKMTLAALKESPLLGLGFENYYLLAKYAKEPMITPAEDAITSTRQLTHSAPHSLYLGFAFGAGIIGLLAFIWLLAAFIRYCLKLNNYIRQDDYEKGLLQGIFAAFIAVVVHGILSMTFHLTLLPAFFWMLTGMAIAIGNIKAYNKKISYELTPWKMNATLLVMVFISIGIVINPILAEKNYTLASDNFESGKLNEAAKKIDWAKRFFPINPKFYELTAKIQTSQGFIDDAIESYKKALVFKRGFAFYHAQMGKLYQEKKMYPLALEEFNQAIALDKYGAYSKEHYSDLGYLYGVLDREDEAAAQFKQAILIAPEVVKDPSWPGLKYLDAVLRQMFQDYKIEKDKNPLLAKQILFSLKQVYMFRGESDKLR